MNSVVHNLTQVATMMENYKPLAANFANLHEFLLKFAKIRVIRGKKDFPMPLNFKVAT